MFTCLGGTGALTATFLRTNLRRLSDMATLQELTDRVKTAVGADSGLGKTLKFDLKGEGFIYIDGASVTNEDNPADLKLTLTIDDLKAMSQGKLAPMTAMMSGRLKLSDMSVAANLQGKMLATF